MSKTTEATATSAKNANVYKSGKASFDVSDGTIRRGAAKDIVRAAYPNKELTPKEEKAIVESFLAWQNSNHGKAVADDTKAISDLVQRMIDAGYEPDPRVSRTTGKFVLELVPPVRLSSTTRGTEQISRFVSSVIALIGSLK